MNNSNQPSWEQWHAAHSGAPGQPAYQNSCFTTAAGLPQGGAQGSAAPQAPPQAAPQRPVQQAYQAQPQANQAQAPTRILSPDEVRQELNAMDPETRQKTIQMGHKLKDIIQAAIDLYPTNHNLPLPELKQLVLRQVGPLPLTEMELPVAALQTLYQKVYGKECPRNHHLALVAMSRMFAPDMEQKYQHELAEKRRRDEQSRNAQIQGAPTRAPDPRAAAAPAASAAAAVAAPKVEPKDAAPAGKPAPGKNKMVSREQYEKMLERMTPEIRAKQPSYDTILKQFAEMDEDEHKRTEEAANKLRELIKYSIDLYSKQELPYEAYRLRMHQVFGSLDSYPQWRLINMNHLNTIYETMCRGASKTPQAITALTMLNKFLPRDGQAPEKQDAGQQNVGNNNADGTGKKPKGPDYSTIPPEVEVLCNKQPGTLLIRTQTVICHCKLCAETAAAAGKPHLELSLNEFERHCGMGHMKKWKFSVRLAEPPNMTVQKWLDSKRLKLSDYPRSMPDDELLRRAEHERDMKLPPEMRAQNRAQQQAGSGLNGVKPKPETTTASPEDVERPGTAGGRAQRQRKQPEWMKQTVDPGLALGGKAFVGRDPKVEEYWEESMQRVGPRGGLVAPPRHRPVQIEAAGPQRKRPRIDSDALLEAEIDVALARGKQPEMHGWRITDQNQLAVTVHLGGVVFSGVLPARPPQVASTPAIAAALKMKDQHTFAEEAYEYESNPDVGGGRDSGAADSGGISGLPPPPPAAMRAISVALGPDGNALGSEENGYDMYGGGAVSEKELRMDERRALAAAEYERLLVSGPPPGVKCAMCHVEEIDSVPRHARGPDGKSQIGLGSMILIKSSAVTNAWVHDQCARWSPDVYDPTGEGILEGIPEAVRRGRMLRCKTCGQKGATLGCMKKTCRSSYHLDCARKHGCLLNMDPYAVACPEHVEQLPGGLSHQLGFKGRGKRPFVRGDNLNRIPMERGESVPPAGPYTGGYNGGAAVVAAREGYGAAAGAGAPAPTAAAGGAPAGGYSLDALGAIAASMHNLRSADSPQQ